MAEERERKEAVGDLLPPTNIVYDKRPLTIRGLFIDYNSDVNQAVAQRPGYDIAG